MSGTEHDNVYVSADNKYNIIIIILFVVKTGTVW